MGHAILSPSSSHRWLVCTPSARLEEYYPSESSAFAEEGTLAHAVCEALLTSKEVPENATEEMIELATRYKSYVEALVQNESDVLMVETKVDISKYAPGCFGTVDCIVSSDEVMHVVDYKFGRGVAVSAEKNSQMMMYALGALVTFEGILPEPKRVQMHIYQPRVVDGVNSYEMTLEELKQWGDEYLMPKAREAWAGGGNRFEAGAHCRFCRARADCRTLWLSNIAAYIQMKEPARLSLDEVSQVLDHLDEMELSMNAIQAYALQLLNDGTEVPHYKIVEGRANRKWKDEQATMAWLEEHGYDKETYTETKLKGIPAIEKLAGKKEIEELWEKGEGKPKLARDKDERIEYSLFNFK